MALSNDAPLGVHTRRLSGFERGYLPGLLAVMFALALLFPASGDDWAWGSSIGLERLRASFADYNGRYAGNLVVLVLTRTPVLTPLVIALVVVVSIFLIQDITRNRRPLGYSVTTLAFVTMPLGVWRQAVAWTSGFANYALAAMGMLLFIRAAQGEWLGRTSRKPAALVAQGLLAFASCLFMEHVTLYLVLASLVHVIVYRRSRGSLPGKGIAWLVGSLVGAMLMFTNGAYRVAAQTSTGYQKMPASAEGGTVRAILDQGTTLVSRLAVVDNVVLNILLAILVCLLASTAVHTKRSPASTRLLPVAVGLFLALTMVLRSAQWAGELPAPWSSGAGVAAVLLFGILVWTAGVHVQERSSAMGLAVAAVSVLVLVLPLAAIRPIGPRNFYPTYLLLLVCLSFMVREFCRRVPSRVETWVTPLVGALAASHLVLYFAVYASITVAEQQRLATVRTAMEAGARSVTIAKLPYPSYVHGGDPTPGLWAERYKLFHGIPKEMSLHLVGR